MRGQQTGPASAPTPSGRRGPMSFTGLFRRYSPLVIAAVIGLAIVLFAPSTPPTSTSVIGAGGVASSGTASGAATQAAGVGTNGSSAPTGSGSAGATAGGSTGGTQAASSGSNGAGAPGGGVGSSASGGVTSSCPGSQPAPWGDMPPCLKFSGTNGGATMPGVTPTTIDYVWYQAQGNAAVDAFLSQADLGLTPDQVCADINGFTKDVNSYFQLYGRKFVPLNGPGSNSGYAQGDSTCHANYFYGSNCAQTDDACWRSDADTILAMKPKPAVVMGNTQTAFAFEDELAKHGVLDVASGGGDSFSQPRGPYLWDPQISPETDAHFEVEYFCKKLVGKPVQFAGTEVLHSGSNPTTPPKRSFGIIYDEEDPNVLSPGATIFENGVSSCGGGTVSAFPFSDDTNDIAQEMTTVAAKLKIDHMTTVNLFMDPLSAVLLSSDLSSEDWHPELVISGMGAIDADRLMQLANPDTWKYAFGLSVTDYSLPDSSYDVYKAYAASGETAPFAPLSINVWGWYWLAATMFQEAGPSPTLQSIQSGMFNEPTVGGSDPAHAAIKFGTPGDSYQGQRTVREVWWCSTQTSGEDGKAGAFVPVLDNKWFYPGQMDSVMRVFPHGVCS